MSNRTITKPIKPYPSFPLTPHRRGWCKKINGKVRVIAGHIPPDEALKIYLSKASTLHGIQDTTATPIRHTTAQPQNPQIKQKTHSTPVLDGSTKPAVTGPTVRDVTTRFLEYKTKQAEQGLRESSTIASLRELVAPFEAKYADRPVESLTPSDFGDYRSILATRFKSLALRRHIIGIKGIFNWAEKNEFIDKKPRYGSMFDVPSDAQISKERAKREQKYGLRMFTPLEIKMILAKAKGQLKAMILLGLNCAFGNTDVSLLPVSAVKGNWIDFPRPKTGEIRKAYLWPETVAALKWVMDNRPQAAKPEYKDFVFLNPDGRPWSMWTDEKIRRRRDRLSWQFGNLIKQLGIRGLKNDRIGLNFYSLRRTFRTIADETNEQHAVMRIMGHTIPGMSGTYIQKISDQKLIDVAAFVRQKLLPIQAPKKSKPSGEIMTISNF